MTKDQATQLLMEAFKASDHYASQLRQRGFSGEDLNHMAENAASVSRTGEQPVIAVFFDAFVITKLALLTTKQVIYAGSNPGDVQAISVRDITEASFMAGFFTITVGEENEGFQTVDYIRGAAFCQELRDLLP